MDCYKIISVKYATVKSANNARLNVETGKCKN